MPAQPAHSPALAVLLREERLNPLDAGKPNAAILPRLRDLAVCLVTGWCRHTRATVYGLWVEGEPKALRVTGRHPFWSADRGGWVAKLESGERLLGMHGKRPRGESLGLRAEREPVYNIEVEGEECYRVGQQGLLVLLMKKWLQREHLQELMPYGVDTQTSTRNAFYLRDREATIQTYWSTLRGDLLGYHTGVTNSANRPANC